MSIIKKIFYKFARYAHMCKFICFFVESLEDNHIGSFILLTQMRNNNSNYFANK